MKRNGFKVRTGKLSEFRPQSANANKHTERGLRMLDDAMSEDGYVAPMTAVADQEIIDGSARLERAFDKFNDEAIILEHDGTKPIITVRTDIPNANTKEAKRIAVRANRIAEVDLEWDAEILKTLEVEELSGLFSDKELNEILSQTATEPKDAEPQIDKAEELRQKWGTETGQLWVIGNHRLLVGDSTNKADVGRLCADNKPMLMVTDPPYGVDYEADWRVETANKQGALAGQRGKNLGLVLNDKRADWTETYLLSPADVAYVWHASARVEVAENLQDAHFQIRSQIIWRKPNFVISRGHYHWQHEACWYAVRKGQKSGWCGDRSQSTIWDIASLQPMGRSQDDNDKSTGHGTQKPLECMARPIRNHSGDVYDPFVGSGTTMVAAENLGRKSYCMEISEAYCAVVLERMTTAFPHLKIEKVDKAAAA